MWHMLWPLAHALREGVDDQFTLDPLPELRGWLQGHRLVVRIGTADARQKLTLLMLDDRGRLCRVAKVGFLPLARDLIEHEGDVLRALPEGIGPKLLWAGGVGECGGVRVWEYGSEGAEETPHEHPLADGRMVVFEPVQGRGIPARLPRSPSGMEWQEIDALLARLEIAAAARSETVALPSEPAPPSALLPSLPHTSTPQNAPTSTSCLRGGRCFPADGHPALLRLLPAHEKAGDWIAALAGRDWPVVVEHGDFAPWNLIRTPDGLRAIDWEDACLDGFPGFDLVHFVIQTGVLMHRWDFKRVRRYAEERLQHAGFHARQAESVVTLAALRDLLGTAAGEQIQLQSVRRRIVDIWKFADSSAPASSIT
jgi:hypothetical protein